MRFVLLVNVCPVPAIITFNNNKYYVQKYLSYTIIMVNLQFIISVGRWQV